MNRRGFLHLLGASVPAWMVLQSLPVDGFDSIVTSPFPSTGSAGAVVDVVDFRTATERVAKAMFDRMGPVPMFLPRPRSLPLIGEVAVAVHGHSEGILTHQPWVDLAGTHVGVDAVTLDACGDRLVYLAGKDNLQFFTPMEIPPHGPPTMRGLEGHNVSYRGGPTVRGLINYEAGWGQSYRFDVLGGRLPWPTCGSSSEP